MESVQALPIKMHTPSARARVHEGQFAQMLSGKELEAAVGDPAAIQHQGIQLQVVDVDHAVIADLGAPGKVEALQARGQVAKDPVRDLRASGEVQGLQAPQTR